MTNKPLCLYLHGLNSSPESPKAQQTIAYLQERQLDYDLHVPGLPAVPDKAANLLKDLTAHLKPGQPVYIIGSSLGGYMGTWLQNYLLKKLPDNPVRLAVINPAVKAYDRFEEFMGPQENLYTGEKWELTYEHALQLKALEVDKLADPDSILLLAQTGDELLDYRLAVEKYKNCPSIIEDGGDHSFQNYDQQLPAIFQFLTNHQRA